MIWIKKLLFICILVSTLYLKPILSLAIFILFFVEYFYFMNYIFKIYKNYSKYYALKIEYADISSLNIFEIWIEICKLQSFQRVYMFLTKKKLKFYNIMFFLFIFFFSIPLKFVNLCYYFLITNKSCFRDGVEIYYVNLYYILKNCKIEFLNGKVYLNCYTIGKLITELKIIKNFPRQDLYNLINDLKLASHNFNEYEIKNQEYIEIKRTMAFDKDQKIIYNYHYAYIENKNSIHGTSRLPLKLEPSQKIDSPIPSLIKENAKNPGSIITSNIHSLKQDFKYHVIPKYEIYALKYNHLELFDLSKEEYKYIYEKNNIYCEILRNNDINSSSILKDLRTNNYSNILLNSTNKNILAEIEAYNDN